MTNKVNLNLYDMDEHVTINWKDCVICQNITAEPLVRNPTSGRKSIAECLIGFSKIGKLPVSINLKRLGYNSSNEDSLYQSLVNHQAVYHKSCKSRFNNSKLQRSSTSLDITAKLDTHPVDDSDSEYIIIYYVYPTITSIYFLIKGFISRFLTIN